MHHRALSVCVRVHRMIGDANAPSKHHYRHQSLQRVGPRTFNIFEILKIKDGKLIQN